MRTAYIKQIQIIVELGSINVAYFSYLITIFIQSIALLSFYIYYTYIFCYFNYIYRNNKLDIRGSYFHYLCNRQQLLSTIDKMRFQNIDIDYFITRGVQNIFCFRATLRLQYQNITTIRKPSRHAMQSTYTQQFIIVHYNNLSKNRRNRFLLHFFSYYRQVPTFKWCKFNFCLLFSFTN